LVTGVVNANFTTKINLGCVDDTVTVANFSTSSMTAANMQYFWDFGDGTNSTLKNPPPHVYLNQGAYVIRLVVSDNGCKDTMIQTVDLNHPINASYFASSGASIDAACLGDSIFFDASPSVPAGGFLNYFWNFGDGNSINKGTFSNVNYLYHFKG
jgi:PKD repeat protein